MIKHKASLVEIVINGEKVTAKDCSKCFIIKPLSDFNKRSNGLGGKDSRCRECFNKQTKTRKSDYDKAYRIKNIESIREKDRVRREKNKEEYNRRNREWYYANRDTALKRQKEYREANKEMLNEYSKNYYVENIEKIKEYRKRNADRIREYDRKYYEENKDYYADRWKEYFEENKESIRKRQKDFYWENREYCKEKWREYYYTNKGQTACRRARHKRREREALTTIDFTDEDWAYCINHFNNSCAYCGEADGNLTLDHFVPVSKLGNLTPDNVIPCCLSCNSSKSDSDFSDWFQKQTFYDLGREEKVLEFIESNKENVSFGGDSVDKVAN